MRGYIRAPDEGTGFRLVQYVVPSEPGSNRLRPELLDLLDTDAGDPT